MVKHAISDELPTWVDQNHHLTLRGRATRLNGEASQARLCRRQRLDEKPGQLTLCVAAADWRQFLLPVLLFIHRDHAIGQSYFWLQFEF